MFLGKEPGSFEKHLPEIARRALIRKGETPETSLVQKIAMIGRQFAAQGEHVETFDLGSTLLVSEQSGNHQKAEVIIEHDYLTGEQDEIEVSVHVSTNGEPEFLYVVPRLTFSMVQEKEIWRLSEATVSAHIPLMDADYLKGVRKKADEANENMASARLSMIVTAELTYASNHPDRGYACKMTDLFGNDGAIAAPDGTAANSFEESGGYRFALSGCEATPASKFRLTAVPIESDSGMKAFCGDESGTIKFDADGKGSACLSRGQVLNHAVASSPEPED
jgi:hypothetical protein